MARRSPMVLNVGAAAPSLPQKRPSFSSSAAVDLGSNKIDLLAYTCEQCFLSLSFGNQ